MLSCYINRVAESKIQNAKIKVLFCNPKFNWASGPGRSGGMRRIIFVPTLHTELESPFWNVIEKMAPGEEFMGRLTQRVNSVWQIIGTGALRIDADFSRVRIYPEGMTDKAIRNWEDEIKELFAFLEGLGVDGMLVSPGFSFEHNENEIFLCRKEIQERFGFIYGISKKYKILNSPLYLKFLKGERYLKCTPWGNPTRNYLGWKSPCYLITDTHYKTFDEYMERTDWDKYQEGNDPRCKNCMMHCGFEPTVVLGGGKRLSDIIEMVKWSFS